MYNKDFLHSINNMNNMHTSCCSSNGAASEIKNAHHLASGFEITLNGQRLLD
jgi:hypothetical protein